MAPTVAPNAAMVFHIHRGVNIAHQGQSRKETKITLYPQQFSVTSLDDPKHPVTIHAPTYVTI